mmetsp:Transcript_10140/g.15165  ORF Transcript_10140/g.15165 Transcript_10140/m.15165 type:complete len:388 (+) Transcript_10140:68-1231(+)
MFSKSSKSQYVPEVNPTHTASATDHTTTNDSRIKFTVLILLCCQNSGHALLTRYSQGIRKETYSSTEVVLVAEVLKLIASGYIAFRDVSDTDAVGKGFAKLLWLVLHAQKIIVLVLLYSAGNLLAYYALARIEASVYTVLLQLKILTTAAFSVIYMERYLSSNKWRALLLLVIGCILVASPSFKRSPLQSCEMLLRAAATGNDYSTPSVKSIRNSSIGNATTAVSNWETVLGVSAILLMVSITGYSAIYFEKMLKKEGEKITIWERNFQLALYSTLLLLGVTLSERYINYDNSNSEEESSQYFSGWTVNTVMISLIQATGGLLVAATLKYADAVLKTLATSGSIVISAVLGYLFLEGSLDMFVSLGALCTILAITNYTFSDVTNTIS